MKARRVLILVAMLLVLAVVGFSRGLAAMRETYGNTCGELSGFPGVLQKMSFLAAPPDCDLTPNLKNCKNPGATCTGHKPTGGNFSGTCTQVGSGNTQKCKCI